MHDPGVPIAIIIIAAVTKIIVIRWMLQKQRNEKKQYSKCNSFCSVYSDFDPKIVFPKMAVDLLRTKIRPMLDQAEKSKRTAHD